MGIDDVFHAFGVPGAAYAILGVAVLAVAALPRLLHDRPISFPIPLVLLGMGAFALPLGLPDPDPLRYPLLTQHLAEVTVIVALTNAGLRIDRRFSWRGWSTTWRLLGVAMPLTIAGTALLGWWLLGLAPAAAVLLGAVLSPTDPVLAAEVQVGGPGQGAEDAETTELDDREPAEEDEVRFGLTSEAGLNDGLAFPYTNLAIAMALFGSDPAGWFGPWLAVDVVYKLGVGIAVGLVVGRVLATAILSLPSPTEVGKALTGVAAIAVTLTAYGATEWVGGYGFLATFVAAYVLRHQDRDHDYHERLVVFVEQLERLLIASVLLLLGGAVVRGVLGDLTVGAVVVSVLVLLVVRPVAGALSLVAGRCSGPDALALGFFGIRGVGSIYYLAYAVGKADFGAADTLWTVVVLTVLLSIFVHGLTASSAFRWIDVRR